MNLKRSQTTQIMRSLVLLGICAFLSTFFMMQPRSAFAARAADNASVRVVHASPAAGNVDVFVDGNKLLSNVAFGTVSNYTNIATGSHRIQVAPVDKGVQSSVIDQTFVLDAGVPYTVAALGTQSSDLSLTAFTDDNKVPADKTKVRVYHLSPNTGPVDVAIGGNTVIRTLGYKQASDYQTINPGPNTLRVTVTNVSQTQASAVTNVPVEPKANTVNSIFAIGLFGGNPALKFVTSSVQGTQP